MKAKINWIKDYLLEGETDTGQKVFMDSGDNAAAGSGRMYDDGLCSYIN